MGIQTHLKFVTLNPFKWNAPIVLAILPDLINRFDVPVHIIEASIWYDNALDRAICEQLWNQLITIATDNQSASFCQWWLYPEDVGEWMPSFKRLNLFSNYSA